MVGSRCRPFSFLNIAAPSLFFGSMPLTALRNDTSFRRFFASRSSRLIRLQVSDVSRVMVINLVLELVAGHSNLLGVDDDDVVPGIDVRRVIRACACRAGAWAISVARRPRVRPLASTRYQSRWTSAGFAEKVLIILSRIRHGRLPGRPPAERRRFYWRFRGHFNAGPGIGGGHSEPGPAGPESDQNVYSRLIEAIENHVLSLVRRRHRSYCGSC